MSTIETSTDRDRIVSSIGSADTIEKGQPVDVYMNLNRDCISIKSRETETYGQVVAHTDAVQVDDPEFVVQPAGRERAREMGQRNVHAFVRGTLDGVGPGTWFSFELLTTISSNPVLDVTYDPFEYDEWVVTGSGRSVAEIDEDPITVLVTTEFTVAICSME